MTKKAKPERPLSVAEYLKLPYVRAVMPESDGTFRAEIMEFPGCLAIGDSAEEALHSLSEVAESWIEAMISSGQAIPAPLEANEYSGKLVLRMPRSLHKKAARAALRDDVSLNQFIVNCVAEQVGAKSAQAAAPAMQAPIPLTQITMISQFGVSPKAGRGSNLALGNWAVGSDFRLPVMTNG